LLKEIKKEFNLLDMELYLASLDQKIAEYSKLVQ